MIMSESETGIYHHDFNFRYGETDFYHDNIAFKKK